MEDFDYEIYRYIDEMMEDYVPFNTLLKRNGLTFVSALDKVKKFRLNFKRLLLKYDIKADNIVTICYDIIKRIRSAPDNNELKYIYFCIVTDVGLLNDINSHDWNNEQKIQVYLEQKEQIEELSEFFESQSGNYKKMLLLQEYLKKISPVEKNDSGEEFDLLYKLTLQYRFLYSSSENRIYRENLKALLCQINSDKKLCSVKSYVLFAVLSRKHGMMKKREYFLPNLKSVFQYQAYNIYNDNGKNFNYYQSYVELYENLRRFYIEDNDIDISLCDFCFANLCPLSEWYYIYCRPDFIIPMNLKVKLMNTVKISFPDIICYNDYADYDISEFEYNYSNIYKLWDKLLTEDLIENILESFYNDRNISELVRRLPYSQEFPEYAEIFLYQSAEVALREIMFDSAESFFEF